VSKKPADVVRAVKERLVGKKGTPAKALKVSEDAPPAAQPATAVAPQGGEWLCFVCGNMATSPACPVDGARRQHE